MLTEEDRDALESSAVAGDVVINAAFEVAVHSQDLDYLAALFTDIATVRRNNPQVSCSARAIDRYASVVVVVVVVELVVAVVRAVVDVVVVVVAVVVGIVVAEAVPARLPASASRITQCNCRDVLPRFTGEIHCRESV